MSECEYCHKLVDFPLPIHRDCAMAWLRGFHATSARYWGIWHKAAGSFFTDGDGRLIYYPSKAVAEHARLRLTYPSPNAWDLADIEVREFLEEDVG